ncbi:hypothetical protein GCM10027063_36110 [Promicromonospora xylanilytica]
MSPPNRTDRQTSMCAGRPPSGSSIEPEAAHQSITVALDVADVRDLALLSDGASRLVDRFDLAKWDTALDLIRDQGSEALIQAVRDAEASDPQGRRWPRGKAADDATVIYVSIEGPRPLGR